MTVRIGDRGRQKVLTELSRPRQTILDRGFLSTESVQALHVTTRAGHPHGVDEFDYSTNYDAGGFPLRELNNSGSKKSLSQPVRPVCVRCDSADARSSPPFRVRANLRAATAAPAPRGPCAGAPRPRRYGR